MHVQCGGHGDLQVVEFRERFRTGDKFTKHPKRDGGLTMYHFMQYRRKQIAELRPYEPGESMDGISISAPDREAGSPKVGDMIGRNPKNHADQWLIAAAYFIDNFEPM